MKTKRLFAVLACVLLVVTLLYLFLPVDVEASGRSGGPDSFGYTFTDSNTPGGPTYNWIEISGTGNEVLPDSDDHVSDAVDLGFFCNFYGTDYSQVAIANNGLVFAAGTTYQYHNDPITQSDDVHGFLAPFWDDLVTWGSAGAIYYQTLGAAPTRMFVVEWLDNQHYSTSTSGVTFEAIMYEGSNNIKFQYQDVDFGNVTGSTSSDLPPYNSGGSATVGIEGPTGDVGLQYSYNEQVITPGLAILFQFPQFSGTNLFLSKQAPAQKDHGSTMTYTIHYHNFGNASAQNVVLKDTLPGEVEFVSASGGGTYDPGTGNVTWNIGSVAPLEHNYVTVTVRIKSIVPVGTIIQNNARISTSTLEVRYDDNQANAQTAVTGSSLPPDVGVEPNNGGGPTPSIYYGTPTTFSYDSCPGATGVHINIHIDDGGPDIGGPMIGGPPHWTYTVTFYPRHGEATVTYTVTGPCSGNVTFNIYIDPAGYIYDIGTNERISGASVWLQRPDGSGGWQNVPTGEVPPVMQPDVNPQTTGVDGQYQWDVLAGSYRVHVEAPGYYPADSIVVSIPPPVTDLHVGLTPLPNASTPVTGITREVNGNILPGVSITFDGIGPVLSDQSGQYEIMATATGNYTIVAHKDGFRNRTQTVNIAGLGQGYAVTCNFQGQSGLIPCGPDIWYALDCVNRWLYPPNPDIGLDIWTALDVINAWLYPGCSLADILGVGSYMGDVQYDQVTTLSGQTQQMIYHAYMKNAWLSNQMKYRMEMSQDGTTTIYLVDYSTPSAYMWLVEQNIAYEMDMSQAPSNPTANFDQIHPTYLGTDTVDGKLCDVYQWTYQGVTEKMWIWKEKSFPIRMEATTSNGTTIIEYKNIVFGPLSDSLFQLPAGVQIMPFP